MSLSCPPCLAQSHSSANDNTTRWKSNGLKSLASGQNKLEIFSSEYRPQAKAHVAHQLLSHHDSLFVLIRFHPSLSLSFFLVLSKTQSFPTHFAPPKTRKHSTLSPLSLSSFIIVIIIGKMEKSGVGFLRSRAAEEREHRSRNNRRVLFLVWFGKP